MWGSSAPLPSPFTDTGDDAALGTRRRRRREGEGGAGRKGWRDGGEVAGGKPPAASHATRPDSLNKQRRKEWPVTSLASAAPEPLQLMFR